VSVPDIVALADRLAKGERLLGLDVGAKTVGLALSDRGLTVASPLETLRRGKLADDVAALSDLCQARTVGGLVVGLPVNMDGSEGPRCQSVRQFVANLAEHGLDLPAAFWDERLSTAAVERLLIAEADMTRKRRGEVVDKMAAAYIMQGALDALAAQRRSGPA
jgi:putative Holliday junction resolvase